MRRNPAHRIIEQFVEVATMHGASDAIRRGGRRSTSTASCACCGPRPHRRALPASGLRRPASTRHGRDGDGLQARPDHLRRAHHRAGRHHPGRGARAIRTSCATLTAAIYITHDASPWWRSSPTVSWCCNGELVEEGEDTARAGAAGSRLPRQLPGVRNLPPDGPALRPRDLGDQRGQRCPAQAKVLHDVQPVRG